jgi:hypothetical protein
MRVDRTRGRLRLGVDTAALDQALVGQRAQGRTAIAEPLAQGRVINAGRVRLEQGQRFGLAWCSAPESVAGIVVEAGRGADAPAEWRAVQQRLRAAQPRGRAVNSASAGLLR